MAKAIVVNPHPTPKALARHMSITHLPRHSAWYSDGGTLYPLDRLASTEAVGASLTLSRLVKPDKPVG